MSKQNYHQKNNPYSMTCTDGEQKTVMTQHEKLSSIKMYHTYSCTFCAGYDIDHGRKVKAAE